MHRAIVAIYGIINVAGGLGAYLAPSVRSLTSLLVGGLTGLALVACAVIAKSNPAMAFRTAGIITLGLGGFWVYRMATLAQQGKSLGMAGGNLVLAVAVLAVLGLGHLAARRRTSPDA
ncbi:MAG: hypothetical protein AB7F50_10610 [Fimbriimonadaceae bacterium]